MQGNTKHRWYDVIVAWANGEKIQYSSSFTQGNWMDYIIVSTMSPNFNEPESIWRIKPKTVTKKYRMALVRDNYDMTGVYVFNLEDYSLDFPPEKVEDGFIRWIGDVAEVENEV